MDGEGQTEIEKRLLKPRRDMRTVQGTIEEINAHDSSDDYVFVKLLDKTPVMHPMEKVRAIYPNAMHVERQTFFAESKKETIEAKSQLTDMELFESFYAEMKGEQADAETKELFEKVLHEVMAEEETR